jgi:hypothetical protein
VVLILSCKGIIVPIVSSRYIYYCGSHSVTCRFIYSRTVVSILLHTDFLLFWFPYHIRVRVIHYCDSYYQAILFITLIWFPCIMVLILLQAGLEVMVVPILLHAGSFIFMVPMLSQTTWNKFIHYWVSHIVMGGRGGGIFYCCSPLVSGRSLILWFPYCYRLVVDWHRVITYRRELPYSGLWATDSALMTTTLCYFTLCCRQIKLCCFPQQELISIAQPVKHQVKLWMYCTVAKVIEQTFLNFQP